ncbi:hypothetical protein DYBT9275_02247 [Dyadobacter sp. CECT 9275]|uniref:Uncharacterized protein n=2 Tax=Dyadobacter helix TaxID=2822344 RepID=A0A916JAH5_9BACT|nr:hypothetical protein DYBT9275_02247 [Dyadobacter sp. CECT 9275]
MILATFLYGGIVLMFLAAGMFIYGVHMFTYRGQFSTWEKDIGEFSFLFWLPTLLSGLISTMISISIRNSIGRKAGRKQPEGTKDL